MAAQFYLFIPAAHKLDVPVFIESPCIAGFVDTPVTVVWIRNKFFSCKLLPVSITPGYSSTTNTYLASDTIRHHTIAFVHDINYRVGDGLTDRDSFVTRHYEPGRPNSRFRGA